MKHYTGVIALGLVLAFFVGISYIGMVSNESKMKQEIECVQAGGKVNTFPHACVQK